MNNVLNTAVLGTVLSLYSLSPQASEQDIRDRIGLGALIYVDNCRKCHQIDGYGEEALYPSLHKPELLQDKTLLIQTLVNGRLGHRPGADDDPQRLMPALDYLSNREIAAVIAFISNTWNGQVLLVTEEEVQRARDSQARH